jgi:glucosamine--fructose-6-phosphate aminotransferase (isomerizing)
MAAYQDHTWNEIHSQPEAWAAAQHEIAAQADTIRGFLQEQPYDQVLFIGCGSTYYLSLAAAAAYRAITGQVAFGMPASEVWLNPDLVLPTGRTLLVPVSRSGATTETLRAVAAFRAAQAGPVLTLSCYADQPLAQMGDLNLVFPSGQEQSIAQTRAFSTLYLATLEIAALRAQRSDLQAALAQLPDACRAVIVQAGPLAKQLAANLALSRCYVLGSGLRYGLASEISLKLKEMSLSESEPFAFLEYRHGPQSMASPQTIIIGFCSARHATHEQAVLNEIGALGATTVAIGVAIGTEKAAITLADLDDLICGPLYLPFGQLLAYERAILKGLDPDHPHQLSAVVRLEPAAH